MLEAAYESVGAYTELSIFGLRYRVADDQRLRRRNQARKDNERAA